jgi:hypothetical protein
VFKGYAEELISAIYPDDAHRMYSLAAQSLEEGGWLDEAAKARTLAESRLTQKKLEIDTEGARFSVQEV